MSTSGSINPCRNISRGLVGLQPVFLNSSLVKTRKIVRALLGTTHFSIKTHYTIKKSFILL